MGPGPVVHTGFPNSYNNFPTIVLHAEAASSPAFTPMQSYHSVTLSSCLPSTLSSAVVLGRILPIVDTVEWIDKLVASPGITDVQLRFKDTSDYATILDRIQRAQTLCKAKGVRLWINDFWRAAVEAGGCFGVHLGQEDLAACVDAGDFDLIRSSGLAFGISTHSFSELAAALGVKPSYISLGPVFKTSSKDVNFDPQGLDTVRQWRNLMPPDIPLVAIGGIGNALLAKSVREAGADCVAVIGAVTKAEDVQKAVDALNDAVS
jgi:thiamine-phosphate diphosphorylase